MSAAFLMLQANTYDLFKGDVERGTPNAKGFSPNFVVSEFIRKQPLSGTSVQP